MGYAVRKRFWLALSLVLSLVAAGCTTCPQADFMDFTFKSKNACCPPGQAQPPVGTVVGASIQPCATGNVATMPVVAAPAPPPEAKKSGHSWLHPFRKDN